jgi:hypothetical protein
VRFSRRIEFAIATRIGCRKGIGRKLLKGFGRAAKLSLRMAVPRDLLIGGGATMNRISVLALMVLPMAVWAAPFQNGSFELGGTPCNTFNLPAGYTGITGWTVSVGNIDWYGAAPLSSLLPPMML